MRPMRYFFAPMPVTGHVNSGLPLAQALVKRGHDVRWYSIPCYREAIESVGARYVPFHHHTTFDGGCEDELRREPADVIIGDDASSVAEAVHAKLGIAWAVYGTSVLRIPLETPIRSAVPHVKHEESVSTW